MIFSQYNRFFDLFIDEQPIIWINGVFDLLHDGHKKLIAKARSICDEMTGVLVVGLNTDLSVSVLKGGDRPIQLYDERAENLDSYVDYIIPLSLQTPTELLRHIRPNYVVKGSDYEYKDFPERKLVEEFGQFVFVDLLPGISTTRIINDLK